VGDNIERDVAKLATGTLIVIAIYDVVTHGQPTAQVAAALGKIWVNVLQVLSGQKAT
jgi:hypothetical protein